MLVSAHKPKFFRRFCALENNPHRIHYLPYHDKNGNLRIEYLNRIPRSPKATINDVTFYLYTMNNLNDPEVHPGNDFATLVASTIYKSTSDNYFIIHGLNGNYKSELNTLLRPAVLSQGEINVFVVDWNGPASQFYTEARNAVPDIGGFIGQYMYQMFMQIEVSPVNMKCVGHGLGAHVCGAAAASFSAKVDQKIDFIVGLDPAGPLFSLSDPDNRLDKTDADYVQVIHTNGELLGFKSAIGNDDFYPNGGDLQPGCGIDLTGSCSQNRAYIYFVESLVSSGFRAYYCNSWEEFDRGLCYGNNQMMMGEFNVDKK